MQWTLNSKLIVIFNLILSKFAFCDDIINGHWIKLYGHKRSCRFGGQPFLLILCIYSPFLVAFYQRKFRGCTFDDFSVMMLCGMREWYPFILICIRTDFGACSPRESLMVMNCFYGMVDRQNAFSLISSRDHCQVSSPSQTSTRREQDLNLRRTWVQALMNENVQ